MNLKQMARRMALTAAVVLALGLVRNGPAADADPIRFGVLPVVDTLPLWVGLEEGLFLDQGIEIEMVSFQSALERDAALQAGRIDGYFGDILNTILLIAAGQDIKIINAVFHTHPAYRMFGVAAAPGTGIGRIEDLENRQVAISRATVIEYLLDRMLTAEGLKSDYVAKQEIKKMAIRLQMLLAGKVSAALLPEPLLSLAESKGAAVVLDDRRLDTTLTVLALDMDVVARDPRLVEGFRRGYDRAVARINRDPDAFKDLLARRTRFPEPIRERYRVPLFTGAAAPPAGDVERVQQWLIEKGLIGQALPYSQVVLPSIVDPAKLQSKRSAEEQIGAKPKASS